MTTTKSYSNGNLFLSAYKNALIKLRGISIIYFIFSMTLFPIMLIMQVGQFKSQVENMIKMNEFYNINPHLNGIIKIYPNSIIFYSILLIGTAILMSVVVNEYMLNKKQVDVYHSLPIKRETMLLANFSAVATALIIPIVICYIFAIFANMSIADTMATIKNLYPNYQPAELAGTVRIIKEMFSVILVALVLEALTFFSCVCSCSVFDSVVFSLSLTEIVPLFIYTVVIILSSYVKGFVIPQKLLYYALLSSPINMLMSKTCLNYSRLYRAYNNNIDIIVQMTFAHIAVLAIILAVTVYIYRKRKSESAQNYDISGFLYKFIIAVAVFGLSVVSGILTSRFAFGNDNGIIIFSLIYGILYFFVMQSIFTRSVKFNVKTPVLLVVCALAAPVFLVFAKHGWFGYEKYIPKSENVKSVSINYLGKYENISVFDKDEGIMMSAPMAVFTEKDVINDLMEIHKHQIESIDSDENYPYRYEWVIEYELNNGKKVSRRYNPGMKLSDVNTMLNLNSKDEFKQSVCPVIFDHENLPTSFNLYNRYGNDMDADEIDFSKDQMEMLYDAMAKDIMNETVEEDVNNKGDVVCVIVPLYYESTNPIVYEGVNYRITKNHVNTLDALQKMGFKQENFDKITDKNRLVINYPTIHGESYAANMGHRYVPDAIFGYDIDLSYEQAATAEEFLYVTGDEDAIRDIISKAKIASLPGKYSCIISVGSKGQNLNYYIDVKDLPDELKTKAINYINDNYTDEYYLKFEY